MIQIIKSTPPESYQTFVSRHNPRYWEELNEHDKEHTIYQDCMTALRIEQEDLSAYTELPLSTKGLHIDHFAKRSLFPKQTFDWNNLLADNRNPNFGAELKDKIVVRCEDTPMLINPVTDNPAHYFTYQLNGDIIALPNLNEYEALRAEFTIRCFGLQHPALRQRRLEIICNVQDYLAGGLDTCSIRQYMSLYGFPTVVEYALATMSMTHVS